MDHHKNRLMVFAVAGLVGAATLMVPAGESSAATLRWTACAGEDVPAGMECATITVPLDRDRPKGRTITLDLARLPATDPGRRIGTVLELPGGPGGSGIDDLKYSADSFAGLRRRFDVVSSAPRTAFGRLPMSCYTSGPWSTQPRDRAVYDALADANRESVRRCRDADPELFDHLDSASVARDLEAIRVALGERRITLFADSYGAVPAIAYARLFPKRVRAMYVDGAVNPLANRAESDRIQYAASEQQFARFVDWCASSTECRLHGEDVAAVWRQLIATADRKPVPATGEPPEVAYTGFDFIVAAGPNLNVPGAPWRMLADAIDLARRGDAAGFVTWVKRGTGGVPKVPAAPARQATECADDLGYTGYADYEESRRRGLRLSPNLAGKHQWYPLMCTGWPRPVANPRRALPAHDLPPLLGAGSWTDHDITADLVLRVPGSRAIRYDGPGHGLYLTGQRCVIEHTDRYLIHLELPPAGTVCPR
jgi:pimeloyl-ACP methyl ester carboxylesterase